MTKTTWRSLGESWGGFAMGSDAKPEVVLGDQRLSFGEFRYKCAEAILSARGRRPSWREVEAFLEVQGVELDVVIELIGRTTAVGVVHRELVGFRPEDPPSPPPPPPLMASDPPPVAGGVDRLLGEVLDGLAVVDNRVPSPAMGFLPGLGDAVDSAHAGPYRKQGRARRR